MPKAGTFLAVGALAELFGEEAFALTKRDLPVVERLNRSADPARRLMFGHFRLNPLLQSLFGPPWKVIVLIRDPRDIVLSIRDFLETSIHPDHLAAYGSFGHLSRAEQLRVIIRGVTVGDYEVAPIGTYTTGWTEWQGHGAHLIRYEQFWSERALTGLARFLGVPSHAMQQAVRAVLSQRSPTLNKGVTSRWRTEMDEDMQDFFRAHGGDCVERLGYDWDPSP